MPVISFLQFGKTGKDFLCCNKKNLLLNFIKLRHDQQTPPHQYALVKEPLFHVSKHSTTLSLAILFSEPDYEDFSIL